MSLSLAYVTEKKPDMFRDFLAEQLSGPLGHLGQGLPEEAEDQCGDC
jgi:hypothetical protein